MVGTAPRLEVFYDDRGWRVGVARNVLFAAISDGPPAGGLRAIAHAQRRLLTQSGGVAGFTIILGARLGMLSLDEEARSEIGKMMSVPNLRGHSVIAIESPGFAGVTVRALLSAIILVSRPDSPQKVFGKRVEGARYLADRADLGWPASSLLATAHEITRGLDAD